MAIALKNKTVVTKKEHLCFSCHRRFPAGTKMETWACIYEGDFSSGYTCNTCVEIMKYDSENEYPDGYVYDWVGGNNAEILLEELKQKKILNTKSK